MCARRARDDRTLGLAYDCRSEVSLISDGTVIARHSCSGGRRPVLDGDDSDPTDTTGFLPMDEISEGSGCPCRVLDPHKICA